MGNFKKPLGVPTPQPSVECSLPTPPLPQPLPTNNTPSSSSDPAATAPTYNTRAYWCFITTQLQLLPTFPTIPPTTFIFDPCTSTHRVLSPREHKKLQRRLIRVTAVKERKKQNRRLARAKDPKHRKQQAQFWARGMEREFEEVLGRIEGGRGKGVIKVAEGGGLELEVEAVETDVDMEEGGVRLDIEDVA